MNQPKGVNILKYNNNMFPYYDVQLFGTIMSATWKEWNKEVVASFKIIHFLFFYFEIQFVFYLILVIKAFFCNRI